jgi:hypothetical protein
MTECWWSVIKGFLYPHVDKSRRKCWHQDCPSNPTWSLVTGWVVSWYVTANLEDTWYGRDEFMD